VIPPLDIGGNYIVGIRRHEDPFIILIFPSQDSYELDSMEAQTFLKLLGVPEDNKFLDYVWNFYAGKITLDDMRLEPLTVEQAEAYIKRPDVVAF